MNGELILGILIIACAPFVFYYAIKSGTKKGEEINKTRKSTKPQKLYEMDMRTYNKNKTIGIIFLFIFFPIGLIILLGNTKPDAIAYKWKDESSFNQNYNKPNSTDEKFYKSRDEYIENIDLDSLPERERKMFESIKSQKIIKEDENLHEKVILTEREKEIIKQLRKSEI